LKEIISATGQLSCWRFFILLICLSNVTHAQVNEKAVLQHVKVLSSDAFEGRKGGTEGHEKAQEYIITQFKKLSLTPFGTGYKQVFNIQRGWKQISGVNLVAQLNSKKNSDLYWVITAHYDHLGKKGKRVFNGANDNASGVSGLLAIAEYFSQAGSNFNLIFLATDAEELGLVGANYFATQQSKLLSNTVLNVNLDMIGHGAKRKSLHVMGNAEKLYAREFIQHLQTSVNSKYFRLKTGSPKVNRRSLIKVNWKQASDHAVFAKLGIPYIYFGADANRVYHSQKDDFSNIQPRFLFASISAIIAILQELQNKIPSD
jgi:Zn-dependent M28 family amino/carboxypeptidase